MENIPGAITAKEGKELELKNAKEYKLNYDKDIFQVKLAKNESKNKIIIHKKKINGIVDFFYENEFTFDDLLKLDRLLEPVMNWMKFLKFWSHFLMKKKF